MLKRILLLSSAASIVLTDQGVAAQEYSPSTYGNVEINYVAHLGGRCMRLLIDNEDATSYCRDYFVQMSLDNGRVIYMIPLNEDEGVFMSLS
ncbi:hypothetical protein [Hydrococcus rivularis]|nr:hypothetical protein [Hydrococcus rivularis]